MPNNDDLLDKLTKISLSSIINQIFLNLTKNLKSKEAFKNNIHLQVIQLFHWKVISLTQAIFILNMHFKYSEARMLTRNMFETTLLMLYFKKRTYEAKRWMNWQDDLLKGENKIPKKLKEFSQYLTNKKYFDTLTILNEKNFTGVRYFKPSYIRNEVFKDHELLKGSDYDQFVSIMNLFSHPTYISLNLNNQYNKELDEDILKTSLSIFVQAGNIFIESISKLIDPELILKFDEMVKEIESITLEKNQ